ncbi:MAG: non-ribosomal peptide synthetase [Clostridium sp.]|nr:non-ribosomal peptide synthetase [Clostridium sp.]
MNERFDTLIHCMGNWRDSDKRIRSIGHDGTVREITYLTLAERAESVAGELRRSGLKKGERVIVDFRDSIGQLAGIWGVILSGGCAVPLAFPQVGEYIEGRQETQRLKDVLDISRAEYLLTGEEENRSISPYVSRRVRMVFAPGTGTGWSGAGRKNGMLKESVPQDVMPHAADIRADDPALILFTSGSTGKPKGVEMTHRMVIESCMENIRFFGLTNETVFLNWLPLEHIASLMLLHMGAGVLGAEQIHVNTTYVLSDPKRLLEYFSKYRVSMSFAPNFFFRLLLEKEREIEAEDLSLKRMEYLIDGGEAIDGKMTEQCLVLLNRKGLRRSALIPGWGMTELCNGAIYNPDFGKVKKGSLVSIGRPVDGLEVRIVKDGENVIGDGVEGMLQVRGQRVLTSYLGETDEEHRKHFDGEWFITGDLAERRDGELIITGRESDIYILNGENYSIGAIENSVRDFLAESDRDDPQCILKVLTVKNQKNAADELILFISKTDEEDQDRRETAEEAIRSGMSRVYGFSFQRILWLEKEEFPVSSIGKIDGKTLRKNYADRIYDIGTEKIPERWKGRKLSDEENLLLFIYSDVLDMDKNFISLEDDFFSLGGNSLKVPSVLDKIRLTLGVNVSAAELVKYPTIVGLLRHIHEKTEDTCVMPEEEDEEMVVL